MLVHFFYVMSVLKTNVNLNKKIQLENALKICLKKEKGIFLSPLPSIRPFGPKPPRPPFFLLGQAQLAGSPFPLSLSRLTGGAHPSGPSSPPNRRPASLSLSAEPTKPHPAPTISSSPPRIGLKWRAPAHPSTPPPPFSFLLAFAPLVLAQRTVAGVASAAARRPSVWSSFRRVRRFGELPLPSRSLPSIFRGKRGLQAPRPRSPEKLSAAGHGAATRALPESLRGRERVPLVLLFL